MTATLRQLQAANYFLKAGYMPRGAAAIVGRLVGESGVNLDSTLFRKNADHGSGGIAEWRLGRKDELIRFGGLDAGLLETQCAFVVRELGRDYPELDKQLRQSDRTIENLTANFTVIYERPNKRLMHLDYSIDAAKAVLAALQKQQPSAPIASGAGAVTAAGAAVQSVSIDGLTPVGCALIALALLLGSVVLTVYAMRAMRRRSTKEDSLMTTIADLSTKLDALDASIKTALAELVTANSAKAIAAETEATAKMDELAARIDAMQAELSTAIVAATPTP